MVYIYLGMINCTPKGKHARLRYADSPQARRTILTLLQKQLIMQRMTRFRERQRRDSIIACSLHYHHIGVVFSCSMN